MKIARNIFALVCVAILIVGVQARADVSLESLLKEMVNFNAVARWPQPEFTCKLASSYDRASKSPNQPGWFANDDQNQFIRDEQVHGHTERVMMDADGPGCIVRFWLTTDRNKQGVLRIYLDNAREPTLVFSAFDLFSGKLPVGAPLAQPHPGYSADGGGGNTLYVPIPYSKHCKVTWEEASQGSRYYQINYRTYAPGTKVQSFTRENFESLRPLIQRVNKALLAPPDSPQGRKLSMKREVPANGESHLNLPAGSQAVRRLELSVPTTLSERELRSLVLQMTCDGETNIWCPVSDFFGSGVGLNPVESWYRTVTTNGTMVSRWVMPYQRDAQLTLLNLGSKPIKVSLQAIVSPWKWDDRSMYFHSVWHYEAGLEVPPPRDWNYVTITGRGVYVGDTLALFNPNPAWYGEGDEKIWVDGESFPSDFGTGTEDYYGFSYAPKPVHQTPFCGEPRIDQSQTQGHSTLIRSRNLDGIPFRKSLQFDMELLPWRRGTLTYAATMCWYAFPGATSNRQPQPEAATRPVPTLAEAIAANAPKHWPGAIECEKLKVLEKSGDFPASEQNMEPFDASRWSGGAQLLVVPKSVGDFVEIRVPAPDDAPRQILLYATQAPDYGILHFFVNGEDVPEAFDGYAAEVRPAARVLNLGVFKPQAGTYTLRVQVAGTNPDSTGAKYLFGLDCIELIKP
jgi:D-arabinan exo alpha-(1,3)/(1,5)-arabinofuranosidase (non-reducing end)